MKLNDPISEIENHTPQEVFDIMCERFKAIDPLIKTSKTVAEMIHDAETNHGGLMGTDVLTAANTLRLELSKWK